MTAREFHLMVKDEVRRRNFLPIKKKYKGEIE